MTATLATDPNGVEYFFDAASGPGANDSGWVSNRIYTDSGLNVNWPYSYRARARDQAPAQNETDWTDGGTYFLCASGIETPTGISFSNVTDTSMDVTVDGAFTNLAAHLSGVFLEVMQGATTVGTGDANTWKQTQMYSVTGLSPGTTYTFRAKARNYYGLDETAWAGPVDQQTTGGVTCGTTFGDVDQDTDVDGDDIGGFTRAKLGLDPVGGENQACADNGGSLQEDLDDFIALLLTP